MILDPVGRNLVLFIVSVIIHLLTAFVQLFMQITSPLAGIIWILLLNTEVFYNVVPAEHVIKIGQYRAEEI